MICEYFGDFRFFPAHGKKASNDTLKEIPNYDFPPELPLGLVLRKLQYLLDLDKIQFKELPTEKAVHEEIGGSLNEMMFVVELGEWEDSSKRLVRFLNVPNKEDQIFCYNLLFERIATCPLRLQSIPTYFEFALEDFKQPIHAFQPPSNETLLKQYRENVTKTQSSSLLNQEILHLEHWTQLSGGNFL